MLVDFNEPEEKDRLWMPYGRGHGVSSINNGYINLTAQPERISEVSEVKGFPELKNLLLKLLPIDRHLTTLRCDSGIDAYKLTPFKNSVFAQITIVFRFPSVEDIDRFRLFHKDFIEFGREHNLSDRIRSAFRVCPVEQGTFEGHCLDIFIVGYGYNPSDARGKWISGMNALSESLDRWETGLSSKREILTPNVRQGS